MNSENGTEKYASIGAAIRSGIIFLKKIRRVDERISST